LARSEVAMLAAKLAARVTATRELARPAAHPLPPRGPATTHPFAKGSTLLTCTHFTARAPAVRSPWTRPARRPARAPGPRLRCPATARLYRTALSWSFAHFKRASSASPPAPSRTAWRRRWTTRPADWCAGRFAEAAAAGRGERGSAGAAVVCARDAKEKAAESAWVVCLCVLGAARGEDAPLPRHARRWR
jgi:hypothetical protein